MPFRDNVLYAGFGGDALQACSAATVRHCGGRCRIRGDCGRSGETTCRRTGRDGGQSPAAPGGVVQAGVCRFMTPAGDMAAWRPRRRARGDIPAVH